jgi:hypothetical protein
MKTNPAKREEEEVRKERIVELGGNKLLDREGKGDVAEKHGDSVRAEHDLAG